MLNISKSLVLLTLFIGLCGIFASCAAPNSPELPKDSPLRTTLSVLQTTTARLQKTAVPTGEDTALPDTGKMAATAGSATNTARSHETETVAPAEITPPQTEAPAVIESTIPGGTDPLAPQPSPSVACEQDESRMALSASQTKVKVGQTIEVNVVLKNTGCVALGLPQYRLAILNSERQPILSPDKPEPVVHTLAVIPGNADEAVFTLQAVSPGKATLRAMASFEVHLGYPGPAYWGANSSDELVIQVEK
jgi:hypothetical protein